MKKLLLVLSILFTVFIFFLSIVVFGLYLYSRVSTVKGSGRVETESRELNVYNKVTLNIPAQVVVEEGSKEVIEIEADDNLIERVESKVSRKTLNLSYKKDIGMLFSRNIKPSEPIRIKLTTTDLEQVKLNGEASLIGENNYVLNTDKLKIIINGSGLVELEVKVKELEVDLSGSSQVKLFGVANKQKVEINGSAKYEAIDLETDKTEINISGSAEASLSAEKELDIEISGSAEVTYKGDPDKFSQDISGSGKVQRVR